MVIKEIIAKSHKALEESGNENPMFEANLIVRHYLNLAPIDVVLFADKDVSEDSEKKIKEAVDKRIKNQPIQYILNSQEFMGLEFYVDENVLIPRQDTECLVETVLEKYQNKGFTMLDIGAGSGCISVSIAHFNKKAYVRGIDKSLEAVKVATKNASLNNVEKRVSFECFDVFSFEGFGKVDAIVSNPPYIETDEIEKLDSCVKDYEPILALDGGKDGLDFYTHIIKIAPKLLNKGGRLFFEVGHNQSDAVSKLMCEFFEDIEINKDFCGIKRVVLGKLKSELA